MHLNLFLEESSVIVEMRARKYAKNFTRNHDRRILGKIQKIEEIFVRRKIEKSKRGEGCKKKVCARVKIALDTLGFLKQSF